MGIRWILILFAYLSLICSSFAADNFDKYVTQINESDFKSHVDKNIQSNLLSIKKKGLVSSIFVDVDNYK